MLKDNLAHSSDPINLLGFARELSPQLDEIPWRIPKPSGMPASVWEIIRQVGAEQGVRDSEIMSVLRTKRIYAARQAAMVRTRNEIRVNHRPPSWQQMGRWFRRNHASIMNACGALRKYPRK